MSPTLAHSIHGPEHAPWLTLSHPIGVDRRIWNPLMPLLTPHYRVLAVDTRGHGDSATPSAACGMDELAADVLQLWQTLGIPQSHFLGLSLGGCIGTALALSAPDRLRSLVVACSRLDMDAAATAMWQQRATLVEQQGMAPVLAPTLERWFTPDFLSRQPATVDWVGQQLVACPPSGFAACARALAGLHLQKQLPGLRVPTLFLAGQDDKAVSVNQVQAYAHLCPGARFEALAGPHILHLENPEGFSRSALDFLGRH
jgi:3-oxoadipate enol-lactonase